MPPDSGRAATKANTQGPVAEARTVATVGLRLTRVKLEVTRSDMRARFRARVTFRIKVRNRVTARFRVSD